MNRIFIVTNDTFPFGNANSNYLRYFALSLKNAGWQVNVIGSIPKGKQEQNGEFEDVNYRNIIFPSKKLPFHLLDHFCYGMKLSGVLKQAGIKEDDYIFVYSTYTSLVRTVLKYKDFLKEGHLSIAMVEWFYAYQFRFGKLSPDYQCWQYTFDNLVPKFPKILPISYNLGKYYTELGCENMVLPIMADTNNNKNNNLTVRKDNVSNFIYPGNAGKKDTFDGLIEALNLLSEEELGKIRFHFTLMSEKTVDKIISEKALDGAKIKKALVFHGMLEYTKLLELYCNMDFLFIARERNRITISNFPSKIPELMSYNIVPVCSKVGDYADYYLEDSKDSIIFDGCDTKSCLEGVKRAISLTDNELLEMKKNARKCVEEKFDYHNWSDKIAEFLTKQTH